ncbi:MAG: STAS domain-containing protein, partial [Xanthomonadales bacterium]|nr:STAS domain-containing protein [Xanthomonadales bacterium]
MSSIESSNLDHCGEMPLYADVPRVAIQVSRGVVVASIQVDLDEDVLAQFREDLLCRIHDTDSRGVILDVSSLETLDSHEFSALRRIISMCAIMGAEAVLVGMRPGVVSALIEVGADVDGLRAAFDLDAAYALLEQEPDAEPECIDEVAAGSDSDLGFMPQDSKQAPGEQR